MNRPELKGSYPKYQCHKVVSAFKVFDIVFSPDELGYYVVPVDSNLPPLLVQEYRWLTEKAVARGGYIVIYEDGYVSYSPAEAFEAGYKPAAENA
jgi:hypothetical protein